MTEEGQQRLCSSEHTPSFTIAKLHKPRQLFSRNSALKIAELTPAKNVRKKIIFRARMMCQLPVSQKGSFVLQLNPLAQKEAFRFVSM